MNRLLALSFCAALMISPYASAQSAAKRVGKYRLCLNPESGLVRAKARCSKKKGEQILDFEQLQGNTGDTGPQGEKGTQGEAGEKGETGASGEDGQLRIYGDASAGDLNVTDNYELSGGNYQFADITVSSAGNLIVKSGTIIRCSGTFTLEGALTANGGATGAWRRTAGSHTFTPAIANAHPGLGRRVAGNGELGASSEVVLGAPYSTGTGQEASFNILAPGPFGGGGGGAGSSEGGSGGAAVTVLCQGAITLAEGSNTSVIGSGSFSGGGGGGGGIAVFASQTSITQAGDIQANGGGGANASASSGPGGGGGGGIVNFIAPVITSDSSKIDVSGGSGGSGGGAGTVTEGLRAGGGGGGASGGGGGMGASVEIDGSCSDGAPGGDGFFNEIEADPTALF